MEADSKYNTMGKQTKKEEGSFCSVTTKRPNTVGIKLSNGNPKKAKLNNHNHMEKNGLPLTALKNQRRSLPVFGIRNKLLEEIKRRDVLIILGETGSGKTTQIPQYIHSARLEGNGKIGVTQPRRVAAISVARRVAQEMSSEIGKQVGYTVRFEDCSSKLTKLKYLTDGMLLREALSDKLLLNYNVIVLDEAHERTIHTDILFAIVKAAQQARKQNNYSNLKILIMSATMDVDHFSKYFNNAIVLYLEGRMYSIGIKYTLRIQDDYVYSCLVTIFQIHREKPLNEDILVFLTGQEEIESVAQSMRSIAKDPELYNKPMKVYPLYASLPSQQQLDVFRQQPMGVRKIILSTNIAETSLTISGIKYVVDSGMVKSRAFHPTTGFDILRVQKISQEQAWQRAGRVGRESNGFCYRMYTKDDFEQFSKATTPEILRSNLSNVILQLLSLKIDVTMFDYLDRPPKDAINAALKQLHQLGAISSVSNPALTELGVKMSEFPLNPVYSRILLSSAEYGCSEEILSIVALLCCENIFFTPASNRHEAYEVRLKYMAPTWGDHISLLNIYRAYVNTTEPKKWCKENYLNARSLSYAKEVRSQLADICDRCNVSRNSCGKQFDQVVKCLLTGLFMNVAQLHTSRQYMTIDKKTLVSLHPSSVLHATFPDIVLYSEIVMTGKCYLMTVTKLSVELLQEIVPNSAGSHLLMNFLVKNQ